MARFTKSGYVMTSKGSALSFCSKSCKLTNVTVRSLFARIATGSVYASSQAANVVGGCQRVMQLTLSLASFILFATRLFSGHCPRDKRFNTEFGDADSRKFSSRASSSLSSSRIATNSPLSPPQQIQPFSATKHLGAKVRSLIVSHSWFVVSSR